jgi:hypothetical protein
MDQQSTIYSNSNNSFSSTTVAVKTENSKLTLKLIKVSDFKCLLFKCKILIQFLN